MDGTSPTTAHPAEPPQRAATEADNGEDQGRGPASEAVGPLARKLRFLLDTVHPADRSRYTYREVIAGIAANGGPTISVGYLSQLVNGVRTNPTMDAVAALAKFFGVPMSYFDDNADPTAVEDQIRAVAILRDSGVRGIAMRAEGLGTGSLTMVTQMLEHLRTVEGLPPVHEA